MMGATVLVVDDEPSMQRLFRAIMHECGYAVTCVGTTREAEAALAAQRYVGMLLDYQLPGEDGVAFVTRAAPLMPLPPTLIVTGHDPWPLQQRALPSCVQAILAKPVDMQAIFALAEKHFDRSRSTHGPTDAQRSGSENMRAAAGPR